MSRISIIAAASENMVIGKNNDLPWHLPSDLKYFNRITKGNMVIMGSKCWESIPAKYRPLPSRDNIVVSRNVNYEADGAITVNNLEMLLRVLKTGYNNKEVFVIGGSQIYKDAFKYAERLYLTRIHAEVEGDTYLVGFNPQEWLLSHREEKISENGYEFTFEVYDRINLN